MKEQDIQREILRTLRALGHYAAKTPAGLIRTPDRVIKMGDAGAADITVGIRVEKNRHEIGFIECKQPTAKLRYQQKLVLRDHNACGRRWLIASDVEDVLEWLKNPEYHGKQRFIDDLNSTQVREIEHHEPDPNYDPFANSPGLKEARDERDRKAALKESLNGPPPF